MQLMSALNPAQQEVQARCLLETGFACVLQMPTGSGKTWLAEQAIARVLERGERAIYLTPLRALANELVQRWRTRFEGYEVGVFTGEYGQRQKYPVPFEDAQLLVMTPERLDACTRHWRSHWGWFPKVSLLVVDELHLLGERGRGPRLEPCEEEHGQVARERERGQTVAPRDETGERPEARTRERKCPIDRPGFGHAALAAGQQANSSREGHA